MGGGGGGKGGGGGAGSGTGKSPYETQLAKIAGDVYGRTQGIRKDFLQDWKSFLRPGSEFDPYSLPAYKGLYDQSRGGLEEQFSNARQNVLSSMPRGGAMTEALGNIEASRAEAVGALPAQLSTGLIQDIVNKAYGAAWNAPQTSISGLGGAAQSFASRQAAAINAQAQQNAAAASSKSSGMGALGSGLGYIGGSILGGPLGGAAGAGLGGWLGR